jgi:hypothetical protein
MSDNLDEIRKTIYYRYFFPDWMFKDANKGTMFERSAAMRHNVSMRRFLLIYIWRWLTITLMGFGVGAFCEKVLHVITLRDTFFTASSCAVAIVVFIWGMWLLLGKEE